MSMMLRMSGTLGQRRKFDGLLDLYTGAAAAYSLRTLSAAFINQPIIRVRRSNDNAEADFTQAQISNGTLTTWTGANNGLVVTWYDQSGNARHATQATPANQPMIVSAGVVVTDGAHPHPVLAFNGTTNGLIFGANPGPVAHVFAVVHYTKTRGAPVGVPLRILETFPNKNSIHTDFNNHLNPSQTRVNNGAEIPGSSGGAIPNGLNVMSQRGTRNSTEANIRIGLPADPHDVFGGYLGELILYPTHRSDDQQINTGKNAYWGIY